MLRRNNVFKMLLLLSLLMVMVALPGNGLFGETSGQEISQTLNNEPRHGSYPADSDYGKPEYRYDTLTLSGSGMQQGEKIYAVKDLENLYADPVFGCDVSYSITGSEGKYKSYTLSGVRLYELLVQGGLDPDLPDSTEVKIMAKDGYNSLHTLGAIRHTEQYHYYNEAGESQADNLPVMVAFASNGYPLVGPIGFQDWFDTSIPGLIEEHANGGGPLKITFGQTAPGSNNAQYNSKLLTKIVVGDDVKSTQHDRAPYSQYAENQLLIQLIDSSTSELVNSETYTVNEVEAMVNARQAALTRNYYPDPAANYYEGIDIYYLLAEKFGLTGNEGEFSIVEADGQESSRLNLDYILNPSKDYSAYYTTKEGLQLSWVKPVLAYAQNGEPLQENGPLLAALPQHETYLSSGLVQKCTGINVYIVSDTCKHTTEPFSQWKNNQITFTGDGLNVTQDFTVENLEQFLELIKEDSYTVGTETAVYRGINLYSLLTSDKLGLKLETERIEVSAQDGSAVSFTLDELQSSDLKVMLVYGKNGKPLVPSEQDQGYAASSANSGGPLYLVVNGDAARCLDQVVQVKVTAQATRSWKHDREAPYASYLDTTFLRICGSAFKQPAVYSLRKLEAMEAGIVREYLAASEVMGYYEGLNLKYLLQAAGIDDLPAKITVCSPNVDGSVFAKQLSVDDVWSGISSTTQNGAIKPVVLAYAKDGYPLVNSLEPADGYAAEADNGYGPLRLIVENAKPLCVKYVAGIVVGDGDPAAYTVNYLDQASGEAIAAAKVSVGIDGEIIAAANEEIQVAGYAYSRAENDSLSLSAGASENNVINLYYEKEDEPTGIIDVGLVISGTGIPKLMYFTVDELESIAAGEQAKIEREFRTYSVLARGGIKTMISAQGLDLGALLQQAGVGTDRCLVKTISSDTNRVDLTYDGSSKSFEPQRYYFADLLPGDNGESGPIDPILALYRAESNEDDSNPHRPTPDELTEVEQFPLPTLMLGQTSREDFNNQYNNKYVQQIVIGDKNAPIFSISGSGLAKKLAYNLPDLLLKGMEKLNQQGDTGEGISLGRLLNDFEGLDDNDPVSFVTAPAGGVTLYYVAGKLENVTELLIGGQLEKTLRLGDLKDQDEKYFLAYDVTEKTDAPGGSGGGGGGGLGLRPFYRTDAAVTTQNAADLSALPNQPSIDMELYAKKSTDGAGTEKIELKPEAKQAALAAENGSVLLFGASEKATAAVLEISRELLALMQEKGMYLQLNIAQGAYVIPAEALDLTGLAEKAGSTDFRLQLKMSTVLEEAQKNQLMSSLTDDYSLHSVPMSTEIFCVTGEKQIKISEFSSYIFRDLPLNAKLIPAQGTVLCWEENGNTPRVVPAVFIERNGQTYARAYSLSNSVYAVVSGGKAFADMQSHWAKTEVEMLASKMMLNGKSGSEFEPNGPTTRAEFAAMLTRALGLTDQAEPAVLFSDISGKEWYAGSVGAAAQGKIVNGMADGTFKPQQNISRQEAVVMLVNALQLTGVKTELAAAERDQILSRFNDQPGIAAWASPAVAAAVQAGIIKGRADGSFAPQDKTSRAEAAVMVAALLRTAGFLDERSAAAEENTAIVPAEKSSPGNNYDQEGEDGTIVFKGSALTQKRVYTLDDLKAMTDIQVSESYYSRGKAKAGWAAQQHDRFTGVSLYKLLLDEIGLKNYPDQIKVVASDGMTKVYTMEEISGLYIDETKPRAELEMIIAWAQNNQEYKYTSKQPFRLVMGQKYEGDFNRQNWVNSVQEIVVD